MRQFSDRYAIHALQNLPEKELRYFNTVIVTADIDEGFGQRANPDCSEFTPAVNLLASVRRHLLYILLRVRRKLCF